MFYLNVNVLAIAIFILIKNNWTPMKGQNNRPLKIFTDAQVKALRKAHGEMKITKVQTKNR